MKKLFALLCAALLLFPLVSCGEKEPAPDAYKDYMTDEQYAALTSAAATFRTNFDELKALAAKATLEDGTDKTVANLGEGIDNLEAILKNPAKLGDTTPEDLLILAETQNIVCEALLTQIHAVLGE